MKITIAATTATAIFFILGIDAVVGVDCCLLNIGQCLNTDTEIDCFGQGGFPVNSCSDCDPDGGGGGPFQFACCLNTGFCFFLTVVHFVPI